MDVSFLPKLYIFVDVLPIPRLVDLVHAPNGIVVEQFKKRLEKLLTVCIFLSRLVKLPFKILQILNASNSVDLSGSLEDIEALESRKAALLLNFPNSKTPRVKLLWENASIFPV